MFPKDLYIKLKELTDIDFTKAQLSKLTGAKYSAIANRETRNTPYPVEELIKIEQGLALPAGSLSGLHISDNCVDLDYYSDVWASCGTGAVVFEESTETISVPKTMIQNFSDSKKYSVINSRGDSMTPFIQDRDKLIVEHWQGGQIVDNCIYVFRYANELFVKRLVKNVTQIVIKSDNPLYEPIKIESKDKEFEVIGQIVGLMRDMR